MKWRNSSPCPPLLHFLRDGVDRHCHLLPGTDDGIRTREEALQLVQAMRHQGIRACVCTPHISRYYPSNTPDALRQRFADFRQFISQHCPGFILHLAAEYMLDESFSTRLETEDFLYQPSISRNNRCLLVELAAPPADGWADMLTELLQRGITPLLAHPERYHEILGISDIQHLHRLGVRYQGNIASLTGAYGNAASKRSIRLRQMNLYACWGTDAHSLHQFQRLSHPP